MMRRREALPPPLRQGFSERCCRQLWELIVEREIRSIHSYLPMGTEVNVFPLLQKALGHQLLVACPKVLKRPRMQNLRLTALDQLEAGVFGTSHPNSGDIYAGPYDLVIVPGLAFDRQGNRIGYGAGYYDHFLANEGATAWKIGLHFPFQLLDSLPVEAHDVKMDQLFS